MRHPKRSLTTLLLLAAAACTDKSPSPTTPPPAGPEPEPSPALEALGRYSIEMSGIGGGQMTASVTAAPIDMGGASGAMTATGAGLVFEQVSSSSFTEGPRTIGRGGQRYVSFTFRVRNGTAAPLNNLTLLLVSSTGLPGTRLPTVPGTPISSLRKLDGVAVADSFASRVVPTGAVALGADLVTMQALYPDVLQVLTEAEAAAITKPADVTTIFPVGFMVRNKNSVNNRLLPVATDPDQFDGLLTVSFRLPLQPAAPQDVFSVRFEILAATDSEVRLTESIEESQDTAAVRRLRDRATALGATVTTVLNGSPAMDPAVADYPGQRQICSPRTAGMPAAPTGDMVRQAAYSRIGLFYPGESRNSCNAYFRAGTPARPATGAPFNVVVRAMDRYGNVDTQVTDSVVLKTKSGPVATPGPEGPMVNGAKTLNITYGDYGMSLLGAEGKRNDGWRNLQVAGVTRTWRTDAPNTNWHAASNWSPIGAPMSLDSVIIPAAATLDPVLASNVTVMGVTVEDFATISLGSFDLTAGDDVVAGMNGGITNTVGRLILAAPIGGEVRGRLPRLTVTGRYTLTGNVNARAPLMVNAGYLNDATYRLQIESF